MIRIPSGSFAMGSENWGESENPIHEVLLEEYWIDQYPVTNLLFAQFTRDTGYSTEAERLGASWGYQNGSYELIRGLSWRTYATQDRSKHPVVLVSWNDAKMFAEWCGKRLPSEAEWEKAARGGVENRLYPWGDVEPNGSQSNFARTGTEIPPTTVVNQFPPNGYGLYDMVGNVWQWCSDWFGDEYYSKSPIRDPQGPPQGSYRVRRGGAWNVIQSFRLRCANRGALAPVAVAPNVGFRCASSRMM